MSVLIVTYKDIGRKHHVVTYDNLLRRDQLQRPGRPDPVAQCQAAGKFLGREWRLDCLACDQRGVGTKKTIVSDSDIFGILNMDGGRKREITGTSSKTRQACLEGTLFQVFKDPANRFPKIFFHWLNKRVTGA